MTIDKTALLGYHNSGGMELDTIRLQKAGYAVTTADSLDGMLEKMGIRQGSQNAVPTNKFGVYIMDLNLGKPGSESYSPAEIIYNFVRSDVESGQAVFMGLSGNDFTVTHAKIAGIPCIGNTEFDKFDEFLISLKNK